MLEKLSEKVKVLEKLSEKMKDLKDRRSIRYIVFASFTSITLILLLFTAMVLFARFSTQLENNRYSESVRLVEQADQSLVSLIGNMLHLSDTLSYQIVKNNDITEASVREQIQLLYYANSNRVTSIAVFSANGDLLATAPPGRLKSSADVCGSEWFSRALERSEDIHVSVPAVQNLFYDDDGQSEWTVSFSCATEITQDKNVQRGVILVDIRYSALSEIFRKVSLANDGYVFLVDDDGSMIYHPKQQLIATGMAEGGFDDIVGLRSGEYDMEIAGEKSAVVVRSVGYTGWKVVGVIPKRGLSFSTERDIIYIAMILLTFFAFTVIINAVLSRRVTIPIEKLEGSVRRMEQDPEDSDIYVGGPLEVQHLGSSIKQMVEIRRRLNDEIVREQVGKQKSELNALQSQINPHFLYNTLDIIVWAIEKGRKDEALRVVSSLGKFFRISLSKGRNLITVRDEIEHVRNYLMIQQIRYRDKFEFTIEAEEDTLDLTTIKLVLQPIVENAIYHSIDYMSDGDGLIEIRAKAEDGVLYFSVTDNGLGMTPDIVEKLLSQPTQSKKGSGIGLKNVNDRIILYFGKDYGVSIESEPDEGTTVTLRMPVVPYSEANENI